MNNAVDREAQRQQWLVRALWRDDAEPALQPWLRAGRAAQGLFTYRANAGAIAERALRVAYPTVAALVGETSFAALARDLWQQHPPHCGDLGEWGAALPGLIADHPALANEAYLADSARLDWQVHRASRAADDSTAPPCLDPLGSDDPERLQVTLRSGCALLCSAWPVASLWSAHQREATEDRFAEVRALLAAGVGEQAFVHRDGRRSSGCARARCRRLHRRPPGRQRAERGAGPRRRDVRLPNLAGASAAGPLAACSSPESPTSSTSPTSIDRSIDRSIDHRPT